MRCYSECVHVIILDFVFKLYLENVLDVRVWNQLSVILLSSCESSVDWRVLEVLKLVWVQIPDVSHAFQMQVQNAIPTLEHDSTQNIEA